MHRQVTRLVKALVVGASLTHPAAGGADEPAAEAAASQSQVPGYSRQQIGKLRVTALFDGVIPMRRDELINIETARKDALIDRSFVPEVPEGLLTAINAFLIDDGTKVILVDAGTAQCFGPSLGQVPKNLEAAGYRAEAVTAVLLTHGHPDHICGLTDAAGKAVYPNATVWLTRPDADYWLDPATEARPGIPEMEKQVLRMAREAVAPYVASDRLKLFAFGDPLPEGVRAVPSEGHTPGHSSFLFDGGDGQQLLAWGDVMHFHAVQFDEPAAAYVRDGDLNQAIAARRDQFSRAADNRWWVAGAHLPFPGIGHVRAEGNAFAWVPTEYVPLPAPAQPK